VERGSLLSHSAIVARELGIPCVVGLKGVTEWLQTGDLIEVDGATGKVVKRDA
jgi:phosphohistidine swiveling domain-containing protein